MFGLMDEKGKPIGFHNEKRIIKRYKKHYEEENDVSLLMFKISKNKLKKYRGLYEDLYLVKYGSTYIQSKYYYSHLLDVEPLIRDLEDAHDVIIRIIEFLDNSDKSETLSLALDIIDEEKKKIKHSTPPINELEERKMHYDEYRYYSTGRLGGD